MQALSYALSQILPILAKSRSSEQEQVKLLAHSKDLSKVAHNIDGPVSKPNADRSLNVVAKELKIELDQAIQLMEKNQWPQAQLKLKKVTRYCISCHTMQAGSMRALDLSGATSLQGLSEVQKGDYYASIRQFDRALNFYEKALVNKKWAKNNANEWSATLQKLLAISVRVRQDASLTMEFISRFLDVEAYPKELAGSAKLWRQHTKEWRKEKNKKLSLNQEIDRAVQLVERAEQSKASGGQDQGMVLNLRASGLLHHILGLLQQHPRKAEVYYYSAKAAEALKAVNFWTFPEDYYQACQDADTSAEAKWKNLCTEKLKGFE